MILAVQGRGGEFTLGLCRGTMMRCGKVFEDLRIGPISSCRGEAGSLRGSSRNEVWELFT
jgi:hypothetical protein